MFDGRVGLTHPPSLGWVRTWGAGAPKPPPAPSPLPTATRRSPAQADGLACVVCAVDYLDRAQHPTAAIGPLADPARPSTSGPLDEHGGTDWKAEGGLLGRWRPGKGAPRTPPDLEGSKGARGAGRHYGVLPSTALGLGPGGPLSASGLRGVA